MKKTLLPILAAGLISPLAVQAFHGLYGDTPDARHAWSVHDWNRPKPHRVTPAALPGGAPSDAVVLFDGSKESFEKNWCDKDGAPSQWRYDAEGYFYTVPEWKNGGAIFSRAKFGDCQLHLEYRHDPNQLYSDKGPQMRGNSGVFLMGNYEIQVLESYHTSQEDCTVNNYTDGQAGSVYAENPPLVNPARKPGEWQVYDIIFHQPVWQDGQLLHPGSVTVFFNGVLVQDHWEMEGLTTHCKRRPLAPHDLVGPLLLQDHGCVVQFRNIWYRPLASRWANTTHSAMSAKAEDVAVLRYKTALSLFQKIDTSASDALTVRKLLEVVAYSKDEAFCAALKKAASAYADRLKTLDDKALDAKKGEVLTLRKDLDVLRRNKVLENCCFATLIDKIIDRKGWLKKKK